MREPERDDATGLLSELSRGDGPASGPAAPRLAALVYDNLRRFAHSLSPGRGDRTLTPTALVNEAYLRMVDQSRVDWRGRTHFFAVGAEMVRRVLVDDARARATAKRGGGAVRMALSDAEGLAGPDGVDVLELNEALGRLAALDARAARVVELRFFGGLREEDAALVLGVSLSTVQADWRIARAWLYEELSARGRE